VSGLTQSGVIDVFGGLLGASGAKTIRGAGYQRETGGAVAVAGDVRAVGNVVQIQYAAGDKAVVDAAFTVGTPVRIVKNDNDFLEGTIAVVTSATATVLTLELVSAVVQTGTAIADGDAVMLVALYGANDKTLWLALFDADGSELSRGSYARVAITAAQWRIATDRPSADNRILIAFPIASAQWDPFVSVRLMSAQTGGQQKARAVLAREVNIGRSEQYRIGAQQRVLRFDIVF